MTLKIKFKESGELGANMPKKVKLSFLKKVNGWQFV
jgi:hypothetical protein